MTIYLKDIPLSEAISRFNLAIKNAGLLRVLFEEQIPLNEDALGRVLSRSVWARLSSPHFHAAAMDGFALRSKDTNGAMPTNPLELVLNEQAVYVDTGDPLPDWANTVIPIENVESINSLGSISEDIRQPDLIRIRTSLPPWSNVRPLGEDIVATQLVLPSGSVLNPVGLGAIAASGHSEIWVSRKPKVAILPTGSELVKVGSELKRGELIEYNSIVLAAQVKAWGGDPVRYPITDDNFDQICGHVQQAADRCDLVLLNAGSSAGSEDYSSRVVECLGELLVHGIAVRPGHPVILGMISRSASNAKNEEKVPIIGIPGYPVSAALTGEIFVKPLLTQWLGSQPEGVNEVEAYLTKKITSPSGDDDFLRVVVGRVGDRLLAAPVSRGAGVIMSLVRADGISVVPRGIQGLDAGTPIKVRLYRATSDLEKTIFAIGSHDMTLDILAHFLSQNGRRLVSANVGSQGGLVALRKGEAHFAGCHLLDPATGIYNISAINQYLPNNPVRLVGWVGREQGLIVKKGNPKKIFSLLDLARDDVTFINRQRGSGTRVLLDYQISLIGLIPEQLKGYEQEEYTHLSVAAAVLSGRADCTLGVTAAATALDLDFIPLFYEPYDLVIPYSSLKSDLMGSIFDLMSNKTFRDEIKTLPGYDISEMGMVKLDCPEADG